MQQSRHGPSSAGAGPASTAKRVHCTRISLPVAMGLFGLWIVSITAGATGPSLDYRIGAAAAGLPGIRLYSPPQPMLRYHLLSERGAILFAGEVREEVEQDPCIGKERTFWYLYPPQGREPSPGLESAVVVLGAGSSLDLEPLAAPPADSPIRPPAHPPADSQPPAADLPGLADYLQAQAADPEGLRMEFGSHDLGSTQDRRRLALVLAWRDRHGDPDAGFAYIRVTILDLDGDRLVERFRYEIASGESGALDARILAAADIDQDGLGDLVLADFGDFYDKVLLIEGNGRWRVQADDWDDPC